MIMSQVLQIFELLDKPDASGAEVAQFLKNRGTKDVTVTKIRGKKGSTDSLKIVIEGKRGKRKGGEAPTLGVIGRLGGIGARSALK